MMHGYFEKYRFKHPSEKDFASFLQGHGIPWYDSLYILTNGTVDVKLTHANGTISIQNDNHLTVPVEIAGFNKNQKEFSSVMILDPFQSKKINIANSFDYILADPDFLLPRPIGKQSGSTQVKYFDTQKNQSFNFAGPGIFGHGDSLYSPNAGLQSS